MYAIIVFVMFLVSDKIMLRDLSPKHVDKQLHACVKIAPCMCEKLAASTEKLVACVYDKLVCFMVQVGDKVMFREPNSMEARKMKVADAEFYVISVCAYAH
jgi:hypothetical protein